MTEQIGKVTLDYTHYPGEDLYCDGAEEDRLLEIVKKYTGEAFREKIEECRSWPVLYHLSELRGNIVDWLPMDQDTKVLEVGAGCGAVTGTLAKKAGTVTCVELSKKRSLINAWRNRECENVTIQVGNFSDIEPQLPTDYDYICLIGVFEYAGSYIQAENPYEEFLRILLRHLSAQGRLVIAIENKYGMKYFAGCREDHVGTYFAGIENYPETGGVRTFGRRGLEKIFAACQAGRYSFYYPYPDYKFMSVLYSDEYLPGKGELTKNVCNYDADRLWLFDERKAYDGLLEEELFPVFSNSYVAVIGPGPDIKYVKYSNDRAPEYQIRTQISRDAGGWIRVRKYPLTEAAREHVRGMAAAFETLSKRYEGGRLSVDECKLCEDGERLWADFAYVPGIPLSELMDRCLEKNDLDGFYALFREYVERSGYHQEYPVSDFDMIFSNIIVEGDKWTVIDYEWTFGKKMDIRELAFRAVICYLYEDEKRKKFELDVIRKELGITEAEADEYWQREKDFQKFVMGQQKSMQEVYELLGRRSVRLGMNQLNRVQIFEDHGDGFSQEHSYFPFDLYQGEQEVEVELAVDGDVQTLRLDPGTGTCVVKVDELTLNGQEIPLHNRKIFYTNGRALKASSTFLFTDSDPNMYINMTALEGERKNTLHVKMRVTDLPSDMAEDVAASLKRFL